MTLYSADFAPENPTMIIGFAGLGLVGTITVSTMIDQIEDVEQIGHLESRLIPAIVPFYDGVLKQPFRLYYTEKHNLIIGFCEVPFNSDHYKDVADAIVHWALSIGVKEIALVQGFGQKSQFPLEEHPVFVAAEKEIFNRIKQDNDVDLLPKGVVMGLDAAILINCLNTRLDGYILLTPVASSGIPSPQGAAQLLTVLGHIYQLDLDLSDLHDQAEKIKEKLQELAQVARNRMQKNAQKTGMVGGQTSPEGQFFV